MTWLKSYLWENPFLQNKAVEFLKTSKKAALGETCTQNHIPTTNELFKISADEFMHSYENILLPSNFNQYFKSIQTIHNYSTRLVT